MIRLCAKGPYYALTCPLVGSWSLDYTYLKVSRDDVCKALGGFRFTVSGSEATERNVRQHSARFPVRLWILMSAWEFLRVVIIGFEAARRSAHPSALSDQ